MDNTKLVRMRLAISPRDMTLREAKLLAGFTPGWLKLNHRYSDGRIFRTEAEARAEEDRVEMTELVSRSSDEPWLMCGEFAAEDRCSGPDCGFLSEALCDYPMGRGKTCDLSLCPRHAHSIGADRDLCEIHFREFQRKCGVDKINPWPPAKGPR